MPAEVRLKQGEIEEQVKCSTDIQVYNMWRCSINHVKE
jgi:hypothetical protein